MILKMPSDQRVVSHILGFQYRKELVLRWLVLRFSELCRHLPKDHFFLNKVRQNGSFCNSCNNVFTPKTRAKSKGKRCSLAGEGNVFSPTSKMRKKTISFSFFFEFFDFRFSVFVEFYQNYNHIISNFKSQFDAFVQQR